MPRALIKSYVFLLLFIEGWNGALPIAPEGVVFEWWQQIIWLTHGVTIPQAMVAVYFGLAIVFGRGFRIDGDARSYFWTIVGFAGVGITSACINQTGIIDVLEGARFILLAVYFSLLVMWAREYGGVFVFRAFLFGMACSGILTVWLSFEIKWRMLGTLPLLLGQNGPGGFLGVGVIIAGLLAMYARGKADYLVATLVTLVAIVAVALSFSKIGILLVIMGLGVWGCALAPKLTPGRARPRNLVIASVIVITLGWYAGTDAMTGVRLSMGFVVEGKFGAGEGLVAYEGSDRQRILYYYSTADIINDHLLFGVGYSGYYQAAVQSATFRAEPWEEVDAAESAEANPHNVFLYYIATGGILAFLVSAFAFTLALFILGTGLKAFGTRGLVAVGFVTVGYLLHGNILPSLFSGMVLHLPVAATLAVIRDGGLTVPGRTFG